MYTFFKCSEEAKKKKMHNFDGLDTDEQGKKLRELCPTLWVQKHDSVLKMSELLEAIVNALEDIVGS